MNLWKDIPPGDKVPESLNMIIEVMSGSRDKYEYDIKLETFVLNRVLYSSVVFPVDYGFVTQTWYTDEDPLDIMVISYVPLEVGCLVKVRPIGALILEDEEGTDPKILSVLINDPRFDGVSDIKDIHPHKLSEIQEFFEIYKKREPHKWVKFEKWVDAKEAKKIIEYAVELYKKKFKK
jgi:inorganic pyrophosphatase